MPARTHRDTIEIACPPEDVYAMVADVTRMGEWSPECTGCVWEDEGRGAGATFRGTNAGPEPENEWTTTCRVVAAEPGTEFAFVVEATGTRWGYLFEPVDGGTRVTESWTFPESAEAAFAGWFGDAAADRIEQRETRARTGIAATLAALKAAAEGAPRS